VYDTQKNVDDDVNKRDWGRVANKKSSIVNEGGGGVTVQRVATQRVATQRVATQRVQ